MNIQVSKIDKKILPLLKQIGQQADHQAMNAYAIGGFVRDMILGRKNLDLDLVIEGDAIKLAKSLANELIINVKTYPAFGTATLFLKNDLRVDLATARKESYTHSGALPDVSPGTIRDDLFRRDFTVNALAFAINPARFGLLVDDFSGYDDLKKKTIRVLHDQSFIDDPTRMLRAVRFKERFKFRIDRRTLMLLKKAVSRKVMNNVKPARYFEEFKKNLREESSVINNIITIKKLGLLPFFGKNFSLNSQLLHHIDRNIRSLPECYRKMDIQHWLIYFMALVNGLRNSLETLLSRYHFMRDNKKKVCAALKSKELWKELKLRSIKPSQIYRSLKPLGLETIIFIRAGTSSRIIHERVDKFFKKYNEIKSCLTALDLKAMGVESGQKLGVILDVLLDLKIDGRIKTKDEERKLAQELNSLTIEEIIQYGTDG